MLCSSGGLVFLEFGEDEGGGSELLVLGGDDENVSRCVAVVGAADGLVDDDRSATRAAATGVAAGGAWRRARS